MSNKNNPGRRRPEHEDHYFNEVYPMEQAFARWLAEHPTTTEGTDRWSAKAAFVAGWKAARKTS